MVLGNERLELQRSDRRVAKQGFGWMEVPGGKKRYIIYVSTVMIQWYFLANELIMLVLLEKIERSYIASSNMYIFSSPGMVLREATPSIFHVIKLHGDQHLWRL